MEKEIAIQSTIIEPVLFILMMCSFVLAWFYNLRCIGASNCMQSLLGLKIDVNYKSEKNWYVHISNLTNLIFIIFSVISIVYVMQNYQNSFHILLSCFAILLSHVANNITIHDIIYRRNSISTIFMYFLSITTPLIVMFVILFKLYL